MPLRHGAHRHVPLVARRAQPAARERALEHARQLRRPADRLPAARRAARLDRRHPGVRTDGVVPVRLRRLPRVVAARTLPTSRKQLGTVPAYVPWIELLCPCMPAAAWGDAAVVVPWVLYERFGDIDLLGASSTACAPGSTRSRRSPARTIAGTPGSSSATGSTPPPRPTILARPEPTRRSSPPPTTRTRHACSPELPACSDATQTSQRYEQLADRRRGVQRRVRHRHRSAGERRPDRLRVRAAVRPARDRTAAVRAAAVSPSWSSRRATASAPASSARHSSATHWSTPATSTTRTTCCCRSAARPGCTPFRWERPPFGSAGTACCRTARSTPAT